MFEILATIKIEKVLCHVGRRRLRKHLANRNDTFLRVHHTDKAALSNGQSANAATRTSIVNGEKFTWVVFPEIAAFPRTPGKFAPQSAHSLQPDNQPLAAPASLTSGAEKSRNHEAHERNEKEKQAQEDSEW
jgi:hypothetical protein